MYISVRKSAMLNHRALPDFTCWIYIRHWGGLGFEEREEKRCWVFCGISERWLEAGLCSFCRGGGGWLPSVLGITAAVTWWSPCNFSIRGRGEFLKW